MERARQSFARNQVNRIDSAPHSRGNPAHCTTLFWRPASDPAVRPEKILSLSFDAEKLKRRDAALRERGFEVVSVFSHSQARHEIEMGSCGIFITCDVVPDVVNQDLMNLFKSYCPDGLIISVLRYEYSLQSPGDVKPDIRIPESQDPEGVLEALGRATLRHKRAS
jgi:hypothetical protein